MYFKKSGNRFMVRIERGEELMESLTAFLRDQQIESASVSGIGASDLSVVSLYNVEKKAYDSKEIHGEHEICSILGNVSLRDGEIWPHLHVVISDELYNAVGGHLDSARISATCELVIDPFEDTFERVADEETGLKLLDLQHS